MSDPWWKTAVFYQIYPRSFLDTDGDGVGDLEGIRRRLEYLEWLGIDALWLSPIYPSPMADFGYDVADYRNVDGVFGTLGDFDRLLSEAHRRGIRLILDWVPNHTSDQHPWFLESRSSRTNPKRGWYVWRDRPNNWTAAFGDYPAWTYDETTGQYYLHLFLPQQPDLNWDNPGVQEAMHDVLRFWLDRGVDGFRADVVHLIGKDPAFPDDPEELVGTSRVGRHEHPTTHELLRGIRKVLEEYPGERMMVGEINLAEGARIAAYYGQGDELHLAFNFVPLSAPWDAGAWRKVVADMERDYRAAVAWPTWVLSNHDQVRHRTRYGSEARARAAAVLLLTLRGTPFLYAGEELGLQDAVVPPDRVVDPGGRDGCRAPIPWHGGGHGGGNGGADSEAAHGWATSDPWLPWPPTPSQRNAADLRADADSILHLYRRLLTARRASRALSVGGFAFLDTPEQVLGYTRVDGEDVRAMLINFADEAVPAPLDDVWVVEVSTDRRGEGERYDGLVRADQGLVLRPAT